MRSERKWQTDNLLQRKISELAKICGLSMLEEVSPLLMIAGGIALALIPGYFMYRFFKTRTTVMLCLAVYYAVSILFSLTGEYPVPFMGSGLSPISGYCLASQLIPAGE